MFHSTAIMLKAAEQFHSQDPVLNACLAPLPAWVPISAGGYVPLTCATAVVFNWLSVFIYCLQLASHNLA